MKKQLKIDKKNNKKCLIVYDHEDSQSLKIGTSSQGIESVRSYLQSTWKAWITLKIDSAYIEV